MRSRTMSESQYGGAIGKNDRFGLTLIVLSTKKKRALQPKFRSIPTWRFKLHDDAAVFVNSSSHMLVRHKLRAIAKACFNSPLIQLYFRITVGGHPFALNVNRHNPCPTLHGDRQVHRPARGSELNKLLGIAVCEKRSNVKSGYMPITRL